MNEYLVDHRMLRSDSRRRDRVWGIPIINGLARSETDRGLETIPTLRKGIKHPPSFGSWALVLLWRRLTQALRQRHLIQIPRIMNPIITWSSWSRRQMIKPGTSFFTSRMFRILPTGRAARIGIWSWCVFSTEMSKGKSVRQLMSDAVSQCSSKTRAT